MMPKSTFAPQLVKSKNVATVAPILDEEDLEDEEVVTSIPSPVRNSKDQTFVKTLSQNFAFQQDLEEANNQHDLEAQLSPPSSARTVLSSFSSSAASSSTASWQQKAANKYNVPIENVASQKQQWRKARSRSQRRGQTISQLVRTPRISEESELRHQDEDKNMVPETQPRSTAAMEKPNNNGNGNSNSNSENSSIGSRMLSLFRNQRPGDGRNVSARSESRHESASVPSSGRASSNNDQLSETSSTASSNSTSASFHVTRQKKTKYAARLQIPGQNPLYLGRFKNEEAAREACERALTRMATPRK